ncbi:hypothetical protein RB195_000271 [Necator americanus]|uniref:Uncharacterized protein n=1 Tax=Necator americanus TaxID=51031 RepID=A0ABR1D8V2_NECAM
MMLLLFWNYYCLLVDGRDENMFLMDQPTMVGWMVSAVHVEEISKKLDNNWIPPCTRRNALFISPSRGSEEGDIAETLAPQIKDYNNLVYDSTKENNLQRLSGKQRSRYICKVYKFGSA